MAYSTRLGLYLDILPSGTLLAHQLSVRTHFSRPLLAPMARRTLLASRQAVGASLRMSNTSGSACPGTTMRADAFVSHGFSAVLLPSCLSTSTNRDCMTRSCKPCFLSVRQMTLAPPGAVTVAAAFSCHAFHCWDAASRNSSFSLPFRQCYCFSLDRAASAKNASCNNSDTLTRAFFNLDSITSSFSGEGSGKRTILQGCFEVRRRRN